MVTYNEIVLLNLDREKYVEDSEVIIEALADYADRTTAPAIFQHLADLANKHKNKTFIATSGCWVCKLLVHFVIKFFQLELIAFKMTGRTGFEAVDESYSHALPIVEWKVPLEKLLLDANVTVVRPGFIFGYGGSLTGNFFQKISGESFNYRDFLIKN